MCADKDAQDCLIVVSTEFAGSAGKCDVAASRINGARAQIV